MRPAHLLTLLLAAILAGCAPGASQVQFQPRPRTYTTIASLSPGASEVIGSLAYSLKMVGRTAACDFPPNVKSAPVVAQVKPDYEKLKKENPELVVYDASLYNAQDIAQIKALGIDTFEFDAKTVEDYAREIREFGKVLGVEMEASVYADKIAQERRASSVDAQSPMPRVALIMPGKGGEHYIAGVKSFQADVVRSAGGEAVGPEQDRYVPIDAESLIKLNPDMFITAGDPTAFANDPRLKSMPAIAKLKVRGIDADLASRMGYRVDQEINKMHRAISDMAAKNG